MATSRSSVKVVGPLGSLYALGAAGGLTDGQLLERFLNREDPTAAEAALDGVKSGEGPRVAPLEPGEIRNLGDVIAAVRGEVD